MLLVYADGRVRLWDVQTTEFWRSMSIDKADELLGQGGWTELYVTYIFSVTLADTSVETVRSHRLAISHPACYPYFQPILEDWILVSHPPFIIFILHSPFELARFDLTSRSRSIPL